MDAHRAREHTIDSSRETILPLSSSSSERLFARVAPRQSHRRLPSPTTVLLREHASHQRVVVGGGASSRTAAAVHATMRAINAHSVNHAAGGARHYGADAVAHARDRQAHGGGRGARRKNKCGAGGAHPKLFSYHPPPCRRVKPPQQAQRRD
jgi:ribosomal protein S12 methylthiotransferase accessory factor YcaO